MMKRKLLLAVSIAAATLIGCGTRKTFKVSFDLCGGEGDFSDQYVEPNKKATKPEHKPTLTGATFVDWYDSKTEGKVFDFENTVITADTTIYARWNIQTCTVNFDLNPEKIEDLVTTPEKIDSLKDVQYGTTIKDRLIDKQKHPTAVIPTTEGNYPYAFAGWYKDDQYSQEFKFTDIVTENLNLKAKWVKNKFVVAFAISNDDWRYTLVDKGAKITEPTMPETKEYDFDAWYSDEERTTKFDFNTEINNHTILYGKWNLKKFTVKFNLNPKNDPDLVTDPDTINDLTNIEYGSKINDRLSDKQKRPTATYQQSQYTYAFAGWYEDAEYTKEFNIEEGQITSNTTLYAKWVEDKYVVWFSDGLNGWTYQIVNKGEKATEPTTPVWEGHDFLGWFTEETGGQKFDFNTPITQHTDLYAHWDDTLCTVKFMTGPSVHDSQTVKYGTKVTRPTDPTNPEGSKFLNWYEDEECTYIYNFDTPIKNKEMKIYAGYGHTVTFKVDKTKFDSSVFVDQNVIHNKTATFPGLPIPKDTGLNAYGWAIEGTTDVYDFDKPVTGDITLVPLTTSNLLTIEGSRNVEYGSSFSLKAIKDGVDYSDKVTWKVVPGYEKIVTHDTSTNKFRALKTGIGGVAYVYATVEYLGADYYGIFEVEVASYSNLNLAKLAEGKVNANLSSSMTDTLIIPSQYEVNGKLVKVTEIEKSAFDSYTQIKKVVIGENIETIGDDAFRCFDRWYYKANGQINSIVFNGKSKLKTIGTTCFDGQTNLKSFTVPASVTKIGAGAFYQSIENVTFEDSSSVWTLTPTIVTPGKDKYTCYIKDYTSEQIAYALKTTSEDAPNKGYADYTWEKNAN